MTWDTLWFNATLATMGSNGKAYGIVESGAVAVEEDRIAWVGKSRDLPSDAVRTSRTAVDCEGQLVTPGLIDCHTHLVYAGDRAGEFEMRLNGASYEEIARAGGGITSTVKATRQASDDDLYRQSLPRLRRLMVDGVTTVEIKSGYGLDKATELKMLRVARLLSETEAVTVRSTFLGAHALPPEYAGRSDDYIDNVCNEMLPAVADATLADAVDAFCENIGFTPQQVERVFRAATKAQLPIKLHAEQLSNLRGAALAARYGALSVDHLEYLDDTDVAVLADSATAAVLLPGAFYCLRETQLPPIEALRRHGVPIAIATDCNPGSSPITSLLLILNMACTLFRLTPEEALAGVTRNAANALGMADRVGTIESGKRADLVLWRVQQPASLSYQVGDSLCVKRMYGGRSS
ncbi:MAG: imidazolonepropionase [Gammaproteobacteria bacterium]|nr:imidazolonepropionase [Gammaproteobacteria bacterium]